MHIRVTTDPMTQEDVTDPEGYPSAYRGDGKNGFEIYFESEKTHQEFLEWERNRADDHQITLKGDDSDDYVAEG